MISFYSFGVVISTKNMVLITFTIYMYCLMKISSFVDQVTANVHWYFFHKAIRKYVICMIVSMKLGS